MQATQIALFGAGTIGRTHIDRLLRGDGVALAAVADPTPAAQSLAASLHVPWFADHRALLDARLPGGPVQGVIVATPNTAHVPMALDCLARGIAVLVEKPIADSVAEAQTLVDAQARTGVPVLVGHHRRHNPIMARARELIAAGRLGRLVSVNAMATFLKPDAYFDLAWRREAGGGPVLINLIHEIDQLRFLLGEITEVQAVASNAVRGFAVEDSAAAVLRFANGAIGTLVLSDAATSPWCWDFCAGEQPQYPRQDVQAIFIAGTQGSLSLPDLALWSYPGERSWHAEMLRAQSRVHQADPYTRQLQHFKAVIDGLEPPLASALDGLRTLRATLAVSAAAAAGKSVVLT